MFVCCKDCSFMELDKASQNKIDPIVCGLAQKEKRKPKGMIGTQQSTLPEFPFIYYILNRDSHSGCEDGDGQSEEEWAQPMK